MTVTQLLLKVLLSLQAYSGDQEATEAREARYTLLADAMVSASEHATCTGTYADDKTCSVLWTDSSESLQVLLAVEAYKETRFAKRIHAGKCFAKEGECDGGAARSPWQLHLTGFTPYEVWSKIDKATKESTDLAAWSAAQVLSYGLKTCGTKEGAISLYGTGSSCHWEGAKYRVRFFDKLMAQYQGLKKEGD